MSTIQKFNDARTAKNLAEVGLTVEWLEAQKVKQNGLCDRCLKTETRKDKEGNKKPLLFSPERKALICSNCATNKSRKATKERLKVEEAVAEQAKRDGEPKTAKEFWSRNRAALTPELKQQLEGREYDVVLLSDAMMSYLDGTDNTTQQDLLDTIEEVAMEVEEFGTIAIELTLIPNFWKNEELMAGVARKSKASETFSKYGYVTAIPDHRYHAFWKRFIQPKALNQEPKPMYNPITGKTSTPTPSAGNTEWVKMDCTACHSKGCVTVQRSIADGYARLNKAFKCGNCISIEQAFRGKATAIQMPDVKSPIDGWGRATIFGQDGPIQF